MYNNHVTYNPSSSSIYEFESIDEWNACTIKVLFSKSGLWKCQVYRFWILPPGRTTEVDFELYLLGGPHEYSLDFTTEMDAIRWTVELE